MPTVQEQMAEVSAGTRGEQLDALSNRTENPIGSPWETYYSVGKGEVKGGSGYYSSTNETESSTRHSTYLNATRPIIMGQIGVSPFINGQYLELWLCAPKTGSAKTGYQLRVTRTAENLFTLTLTKWNEGAELVLAEKTNVSISAEGYFGMAIDGSNNLTAWSRATATGSWEERANLAEAPVFVAEPKVAIGCKTSTIVAPALKNLRVGSLSAGTASGKATVSGTGTLSPKGQTIVEAKALISGSGSISPRGIRKSEGRAAISGSGTIKASSTFYKNAKATISGTGSISPKGLHQGIGRASVQGTGLIAPKVLVIHVGSTSISGSGSIIAGDSSFKLDKAQITGQSALTSKGIVIHDGATFLFGTGKVQAEGRHLGGGLFIQYKGALHRGGFFIKCEGALHPISWTVK